MKFQKHAPTHVGVIGSGMRNTSAFIGAFVLAGNLALFTPGCGPSQQKVNRQLEEKQSDRKLLSKMDDHILTVGKKIDLAMAKADTVVSDTTGYRLMKHLIAQGYEDAATSLFRVGCEYNADFTLAVNALLKAYAKHIDTLIAGSNLDGAYNAFLRACDLLEEVNRGSPEKTGISNDEYRLYMLIKLYRAHATEADRNATARDYHKRQALELLIQIATVMERT